MARKKRLKEVEEKLTELAQSVSRLQGEIRKTARLVVGGPAKRANSTTRTGTHSPCPGGGRDTS